MKILVTGANGYIGRRFIKLAMQHKHTIISATRKPLHNIEWLPFDLSSQMEITLPENIDIVIHLATFTLPDKNEQKLEIKASEKLILAASNIKAKIIFISSQTAQKNAPTIYGQTKWHIEQKILSSNGLVIRLGQVYGGPESGLFGTLCRIVKTFPVLPLFIPSPLVQPIHVDDCALALLKFSEKPHDFTGIFKLATPHPISFTTFISRIALYRIKKNKLFIPFPVFLITFFVFLLGQNISRKTGLLRLTSLFSLPVMDTQKDLEQIGLKLRGLSSGMHKSGNDTRRQLIMEGNAVLTYLLKEIPSPILIRRYVHMTERLRQGIPLNISRWALTWPVFLSLYDNNPSLQGSKEIAWRLNAATIVAEASTQGARRFLGSKSNKSIIATCARIALSILTEILWRVIITITPRRLIQNTKKNNTND